jgi:hypothetical protein
MQRWLAGRVATADMRRGHALASASAKEIKGGMMMATSS